MDERSRTSVLESIYKEGEYKEKLKRTLDGFDLEQSHVCSQRNDAGLPDPHAGSFPSRLYPPRSREGQRLLCHGSVGPLLSLQVLYLRVEILFHHVLRVISCYVQGTWDVTWDEDASLNKER